MEWSKYQVKIYHDFEFTVDSLLVEAVAGSGKTTVLVELAKIASRAFPHLRIVFVAFSKDIAEELNRRFEALGLKNVMAKTLHSVGWAAWRRAGGLDWEPRVSQWKVSEIIREMMDRGEQALWAEGVRKVVSLGKAAGIVPVGCIELGGHGSMEYRGLIADTDETWQAMLDHYGIDPEDVSIPWVRKVLSRSIETAREKCDFDDMLMLPVIANVPFDLYDVVFVDEAQDLSEIQHEMISRMVRHGGRVVACGDRAQAIYSWRGAHSDSMDRLKDRFAMRELPLSVSYRCPQAVVLHARAWVPQIEWRDGAEAGYVGAEGTDWRGQAEVALGAPFSLEAEDEIGACCGCTRGDHWIGINGDDVRNCKNALTCGCERDSSVPVVWMVKLEGITKWQGIGDFSPGDAVLCRLTRPLVAAAFRLIRERIACRVLGRDIGGGLVAVVKRSKLALDAPVSALEGWMDGYRQRETERLKRRQQWAAIGQLDDRLATIGIFIEEAGTVGEVIREIEGLFVDNGGTAGMVVLSTVHKAKGLEWPRVFILDAGKWMPCPWAREGWEREQEANIQYVAATRACHELRYITSGDLGLGEGR